MFGPPGTLYVYRSYGIHWCANVVCEPEGTGAAVLLRAIEPTHGIDEMRIRRGPSTIVRSAPARGSSPRHSGSTARDDGLPIAATPFALVAPRGTVDIVATPRIGITKATELPWRYVVKGRAGRRAARR